MKGRTVVSMIISMLLALTWFANLHAAEVQLTASDGAASDYFGISVSISGDYAIVGAYWDDSEKGSAYIFERSGAAWSQIAKLTASDGAVYDSFGYSVSISGDYAIVGAYRDDIGENDQGSAYIFEKPGGGWSTTSTYTAKLIASDGALNDYFGMSVSISGDYAIVGAYGDDDKGSTSGSAYIFEKPGGGWTDMTQTAKLTASDGAVNDRFGYSVSISGDYVIVGAYKDDIGASSEQGSAYIFEKPGGGWTDMTQTAKLTTSDGAAYDYFGMSVSISGDYAIVGAYRDDDKGNVSGSAYIFEKPGGGWSTTSTYTAKLTASDGAAYDYFGYSVSISGDYAIVGAYGDDSGKGSAYSFLRSGGSWSQKEKQIASDRADGDNSYFGRSVSIYDNYAIVGADMHDVGGNSDQGQAYIYHSIDDLSLPVELSAFTATASGFDTPSATQPKGLNVILKWRTESEVNNIGFAIYRSEEKDGNYTKIAFVKGAGSTAMPTDYKFVDKKVEAGKTYFYYLQDIDIFGETNRTKFVKVIVPFVKVIVPDKFVKVIVPAKAIPKEFRLLQSYPNPFNPETWIPYQLARDAEVTIRIYNVFGQLVNTISLGMKEAGYYVTKNDAAYWDGKNSMGESVSSGVYLYTIQAGEFFATRRMVVIK